MGDKEDNLSYIQPRNPSLAFFKRPFQVSRTNLLPLLENVVSDSSGKMKVFLRLKPVKENVTFSAPPQDHTFEIKDSHTLLTRNGKDSIINAFRFTQIFEAHTTQEKVYEESVHNLVRDFINGSNCLLFAYGTSSAGKTYTIQGTPEDPGIIPRAINVLFTSIHGKESQTQKYKPDMVSRVLEIDEKTIIQDNAYKQRIMSWCSQDKCSGSDSHCSHSSKSSWSQTTDSSLDRRPESSCSSLDSQVYVLNSFREMQARLNNSLVVNPGSDGNFVFSIWVSFAEIYNEYIYDLLEPLPARGKKRRTLPVGQDAKGQMYIKGLQHIKVNSGDEAYQVMLYGQHNLKFAPTGLNSASSRSHCIFTIKLLQHVNTEEPKYFRVSMFSFCDLAGAERAKNTLNCGERLRESQNINNSLHVLGRCLMTIRNNQTVKTKKLIPFRDSKLTSLFQKALLGKESVTMIVNINPSATLRDETFHVLTFSAIARQIVLQPVKEKKRIPRSSRFSQYVLKHSTMISNVTREDEASCLSLGESSTQSQELQNQIEVLNSQIDQMKEELAKERNEKISIETEIRHELCTQFSNMMVEAQTAWENRLEDTQFRCEDLANWRVAKLEAMLQEQSRKRRCTKDFSDNDTTLQDADEEVAALKEKLTEANNLLQVLKSEKNGILLKCSKLEFELSHCKETLKDFEKVNKALQAMNKGDSTTVVEIQERLKTLKEEMHKKDKKIQELEGVIDDAKTDYNELEQENKELEKVAENYELTIAEKDDELKQTVNALQDNQKVRDQLSSNLELKDEHIEELEKELSELREKYESRNKVSHNWESMYEKAMKENSQLEACKEELTSKVEQLEAKLASAVLDNKALLSDMSTVESQNAEIRDLENKLKESRNRIQQSEVLEMILQKEILELRQAKENLEYKIHTVEVAEKDVLKRMIAAETALAEKQKEKEEYALKAQSEISNLKLQLQSCKENADFVRSLKDEMEGKSLKYEELESQNASLRSELEIKEIEMTNFQKNRDHLVKTYEDLLRKEKEESERHKREVQRYQQTFLKNTPTPNKSEYEKKCGSIETRHPLRKLNTQPAKIRKLNDEATKKDIELKDCYVKIHRLEEQLGKQCISEDTSIYDKSTLSSDLKSSAKKLSRRATRKKLKDENDPSAALSSERRRQQPLRLQTGPTVDTRDQDDKWKGRTRRKNLFAANLDESCELEPVETSDIPRSMSPMRILRSRRM